MFVPRRGAKPGQSGVSSSSGSSTTTTTTTVTKSAPSSASSTPKTSFKTVTKQVAPATVRSTSSLAERQALAAKERQRKRQLELDDAADAAERENGRDESAKRKKQQRQLERLREEKGKSRAVTQDDGAQRAIPKPKVKYTIESFDESASSSDDDGRLGTPMSDKRGPLRVPRFDMAAPTDTLKSIQVTSGADIVKRNLSSYIPYFEDIPKTKTVTLEYPGDNASEAFLLLRPRTKDQEDYQPIQDIISTIRVICDWFLTPEQALEHFKHVANQSSSSGLSDFDFLNNPAPSPHTVTRDSTPASDLGTPEPSSSTSSYFSAALSKDPLLRQLEKAFRRKQGQAFLSAIEHFNSVLLFLKESGAIRKNIETLGAVQGIPEAVWQRVSGQCYERTVGPRVEELRKYEAFSDNTYGELLPPFVSHIASLTGLKPGSVLVDMGSGVGNCCVQASLATGCKSYGFENQSAAASIASAQVKEAEARARLWGLQTGDCETHEVDFLASPGMVGPALSQADVVLVNNYVFSPNTNESLSLMFLDLKDGAKVVSLRPFVSISGETAITSRNVGSPANILNQSKPIKYDRGSVSWSDTGGSFFIAEVNRDRLKRYLEKMGG